jgi:hypothetical protein
MNHAQWRAKSEAILNQMELVPYKSPAYFVLKNDLEKHLHAKPIEDDDAPESEWVMSSPSPLI